MDNGRMINNEWIEYTEEELEIIKEKNNNQACLKETDWYAGQVIENLFLAIGDTIPTDEASMLEILTNIVEWRNEAKIKFDSMLNKRDNWRKRINELSLNNKQ